MRKFLYNVMLFAAVCLVGCQSEQLVEGNETDKKTRTIEIFAEMEGEAGSRTALDGSKGQLKWQAGDQLSVFLSGKKSLSAFTINSFTEGEATFTGEVQDDENTLSANVAFYPYNESVTYNDSKSSLTTSIPSTQTSNGDGTFAQGVYPMMAVTDGKDSYNFAFKNVLAGTQLYVTGNGQKIAKVVMEVNNHPLAGDYTVKYSKEGVTVTPGENTKNSIELDCRDKNGNSMTLTQGQEYVFTFVHFPMREESRTVTFTLYEEKEGSAGSEGSEGSAGSRGSEGSRGIGTLKKLEKQDITIGFSSNSFKHIKVKEFSEVSNTVWVANATSLEEAVSGSTPNVVLAEDVTLDGILTIKGNGFVLDGNGKTLTSKMSGANGRAINVSGANNVTIKNLNIVASGERAINIIQNSTNVTIENVTATCSNYAVNVAGSAAGAKVSIQNSNLTGLNVVNIAAPNTQVTVTDTDLTCNDKSSTESYGAISVNSKDGWGTEVEVFGGQVAYNDDSYAASYPKGHASVTFSSTEGELKVEECTAYVMKGENYSYATAAINGLFAKNYIEDDDVVEVIADVEISETISIKNDVTINLNGYKLTANVEAGRAFDIVGNDVEFTLNAADSEIEFGNKTYGIIQFKGEATNNKVTVNRGTFEGTTDAGAFVRFRAGKKNTLVLNDVNYTDKCAVQGANKNNPYVISTNGEPADNENSITINGGKYVAGGIVASASANFSMKGAEIEATGLTLELKNGLIENSTITLNPGAYVYSIDGAGLIASNSGEVAIKNSTINVSGDYKGIVVAPTGGSVNVSECTINAKTEYFVYDQYEGKSGSITVDGSEVISK